MIWKTTNIKLGICGEHGGEPHSVAFCHQAAFVKSPMIEKDTANVVDQIDGDLDFIEFHAKGDNLNFFVCLCRAAFRAVILLAAMSVILVRPTMADTDQTFSKFLRCDGLIGKSPQAVLAVLGPPSDTVPLPPYKGAIQTLRWRYEVPPFISYELIFRGKVLEMAVITVDGSNFESNLGSALKVCNSSSRKMSYNEAEAEHEMMAVQMQTSGKMTLLFTGTTENGHLLLSSCDATTQGYPVYSKRVINTNSGLYEDKIIKIQPFVVESVSTQRIILLKGTADYKIIGYCDTGIEPQDVSIGINIKNSPWFFSPTPSGP